MAPPRTLVVIPTFDHGPTLRRSVGSALAQTVEDLDVVVLGDGAPPPTGDLMAELCQADDRLRYVERPKGGRHGEAHRHEVLSASDASVVCYLGDDDLWTPDHVEEIHRLLDDADFAHTLPIRLTGGPGDEQVVPWIIDLTRADHRALIVGPEPRDNRIPLGCAGHTMAAYRRLPHGWRPAPADQWSDHWMWQQILGQDWVRARSGSRPTLLHLPSSRRRDVTMPERLTELDRWAALLADERWRTETLPRMTITGLHRGWADDELALRQVTAVLAGTTSELVSTTTALDAALREVERLGHVERERDAMVRSRTWRLRTAVCRVLESVGRFSRAGRASSSRRR